MTPRARLLATLRREPVDRIPTAVICIDACGDDHRIKPDVPPANTVALFDATTSYRAGRKSERWESGKLENAIT